LAVFHALKGICSFAQVKPLDAVADGPEPDRMAGMKKPIDPVRRQELLDKAYRSSGSG